MDAGLALPLLVDLNRHSNEFLTIGSKKSIRPLRTFEDRILRCGYWRIPLKKFLVARGDSH